MAQEKKRKSLRRLVFTWFLFFTLLPLCILAVVIQNQYQKSINQQIKDRLTIHVRELESLFTKERNSMEEFLQKTLRDNSLIYYMSTLEPSALKATLSDKIIRYKQSQVKIYTTGGEVFVHYDGDFKSVHGQAPLDLEIRAALEDEPSSHQVLFQPRGEDDNVLSLSLLQKIVGVQDRTVGFIETILSVDQKYLGEITRAMGAELVFFDGQGKILLGSLPRSINQMNLGTKLLEGKNSFFEFSINSVPYAFMSTAISWGERAFLIGMGSSKQEAESSIRQVNYVILFTFLSFLVFLIIMSFYFVREVISPIESLIKASRELKDAREAPIIDNRSRTEVAELIDAFNEMSQQIVDSDQKMKKQLDLLEQANTKIKSTQTQLVQSAKLASLGELVAGIAHELNNPIGFIYSNISHLREYSQALFKIIDKSRINKNELDLLVVEEDYEYIKKDFPKLIQSCEEGSHRAKEIVIGLRNFSRADEEKTEAFDVNKGIDSTLKLLGGEIKNRAKVIKDYHDLPMVNCNVNQMKQVFMNILNNAAQAIQENGEIKITTNYISDLKKVRIQIKDNGIGIKKENIEKIFDPFYTTKSVGEGTGLGLSISYGIVRSHGGDIGVESTVGKGTLFTVDLPIYRE
jgi:two-component system, NtrC family, sensor kinase